jgi:O-antigen/teichoic acid export membrane protein
VSSPNPQSTAARVRRLLRNAGKLVVADGIASLIALLQSIVLARALGAAGFGLLALVIVFVNVFNQVVDIRLWETVTKFVAEFHERRQHGHARAVIKLVYLLDAGTGVLAFVLVVLLAPVAAERIFHRPEAAALMVCYSVTLLIGTVNQTSLALLRVFNRFTTLSIELVVSTAVRFVALALVASHSGAILPIIWTYVAVELVRALGLLVLGLRTTRRALAEPGPSGLGLLRPRLREFVGFSIHNSLTTWLAALIRQVDVLILAAFRGDAQVGYFRLAKQFAKLLLRLTDPVYQAIYPELVRLREQVDDLSEIRRFISQTMSRVLLLIVPATIMIGLGAPIIIEMTVGSEFLPAAAAVRIMAAGVLVNAALVWARPLALTAGRPVVSTIAFVVSAVVLVAGSALLVPRYGFLGSAVTFLLTMSTAAGVSAVGAVRAARDQQAGRERRR